MSLRSLLRHHRLVVCVGSGGVGKTTTAAALGVLAAHEGRKVLVLTIDPARRLANALGIAAFGNEERQIPLPEAEGELWAMMLDTRSTFDDLIHRISPDEETRARILDNQVYQVVSDSFGSSQAYMATERLYDVWRSNRYDLIILDTPPVKNALDFIEAPGRMARFLDRRILKWFLRPYDENRVFGRMFIGTSGVVFRLLSVIFGREFLEELSLFLLAFRELYDGFRERHQAVVTLFSDPRTSFLTITAPSRASFEVASYFVEEFQEREIPHHGLVVNQVHRCTDRSLSARDLLGDAVHKEARDLPEGTADALLKRLDRAHERLRAVGRQERSVLDRIESLVPPKGFLVQVPRLDEPIRDLSGLRVLARHLVAEER